MIAILMIAGIIAYVGIAGSVYRWVRRKTESKLARFMALFALVFFAIGDNIIGEAAFYYLCKTQGGKKIYKTVDNVDGFFVENFKYGFNMIYMDELIYKKYLFIENYVLDPKEEYFAAGEGLHRFTTSTTNDESCRLYNKWKHDKTTNKINFYKEYTDRDICISSNKIDIIKSKYSVSYYKINNYIPLLPISKYTTEIKNIATGEILGVANSFNCSGGWILDLTFGGSGHTKKCPDKNLEKGEVSIHKQIIYDVLKSVEK